MIICCMPFFIYYVIIVIGVKYINQFADSDFDNNAVNISLFFIFALWFSVPSITVSLFSITYEYTWNRGSILLIFFNCLVGPFIRYCIDLIVILYSGLFSWEGVYFILSYHGRGTHKGENHKNLRRLLGCAS